ncbi:conserved exported hypothetical protein [Flavobacterium psychrophilum]|uniref:hypothetical protein n=1 Tax=Flavobacterium psychrophilum TaxID=96345 RepID=UPI000B7C27B0|nr:hypothetical protein [Flavobacterium psychrophilum]SNB23795.1 conserved exported hypothetical protein [Flavobacterium psychrophilum]
MNIKIFITIIVFSLLPCNLIAQEYTNAKELLEAVSKNYNKKSKFSFYTNVAVYKNYNDKTPKEKYEGLIIKNSDAIYCKIKGMELLSFNDCSLKISNEEKMILYSEGKQQESMVPTDISLIAFLKDFKWTLKSTATQYICEFVPKTITQIMCSKVIFYINKSDLLIAKQITYLTETIDESNPKKPVKITPMILVSYKKRTSAVSSDQLLTNKRNYIIKNGDNVILAKKYSNFQLIKS